MKTITISFKPIRFEEQGFRVAAQDNNKIKVIKEHCEVHIEKLAQNVLLSIPVMTLKRKQTFLAPLLSYLLERNGSANGPGYFSIIDNCIFYQAIIRYDNDVVGLALDMQQLMEELGPKILNVAKQ